MARLKRERFDKDKPLVAIRFLTLYGKKYDRGDLIDLNIPEGVRKKIWKARKAVHDGAPLRGKSTDDNNAQTITSVKTVKPTEPKKRGRPSKKAVENGKK